MLDVFFFSSRRRHTRYWRDWSSDVCSSDLGASPTLGAHVRLPPGGAVALWRTTKRRVLQGAGAAGGDGQPDRQGGVEDRESGGEGKSVDLGGGPIIKKKKIKVGSTIHN